MFEAPKELKLKVGAKVMFTKNSNEFLNGGSGVVKELAKNKIIVYTENGTLVDLEKSEWEWFKYEIKEIDGKKEIVKTVVATYRQYPVKLGWAMTIHKSQGLTLKDCNIDLGEEGAFVSGQLYVGLSRCKEMNKISLINRLNVRDVKINRNVMDFYRYYF